MFQIPLKLRQLLRRFAHRSTQQVKPPVTVNVTDVDAVEPAAAPKAAPEPRSRSKPSWRKTTKAEERKGREDEDRMLEPSSPRVPSSSPEKIEIFETSEKPAENISTSRARTFQNFRRDQGRGFTRSWGHQGVFGKVSLLEKGPVIDCLGDESRGWKYYPCCCGDFLRSHCNDPS